ncbi:MAG: ABC transporter ATP-binding protein [Clostridiales bacterium]|nr:ABC transporter ATP-binding protein [Clostridiales bacterium]
MAGPEFVGAPHDGDKKPKITKKLLLRILSYFNPYWKSMLVMLGAIILSASLGVVTPILTKNIIDIALPSGNMRLLVFYIVLSFAALFAQNLISVGQSYLNTLISKRIIRDLRSAMYGKMMGMPLRFFSDAETGEINSRITNDIGGIENVFSGTFIQIVQGVFVFATTAVTLFYTNWMLAIVSILTLPLFLLPTRRVGKTRWKITAEMQEKLARLTSIITETLNAGGAMLIKLFTKEKDKRREFDEVNDIVARLGIREAVAGQWFFMTIMTFVAIGPMLIYLFGGMIMLSYKTITVGGIVMFVSLLNRLYGPVNTFMNIHVDIVRSMALFERIFHYLDLDNELVDMPDAKVIEPIAGDIRFDNVSFSYNDKAVTLKEVTFEIPRGRMAAFVGPSGAGKTTVTYLVPRLYDVTEGAVSIDGTDIRKMALHSLRGQIGMVTQDTYLFNASIRSNLLFARSDAMEEDLIEACKTAHIHDFIAALPNGYDTIVGDRGIKLSGGERQRLSIARTLLKNPKIVIFDEATSSLDSNSEALIQQAIEPLLKSRTSLVIAHRLSTIMSADVIFVVNDGRIAQRGSHAELLRDGGIYKDLYDRQFTKLP